STKRAQLAALSDFTWLFLFVAGVIAVRPDGPTALFGLWVATGAGAVAVFLPSGRGPSADHDPTRSWSASQAASYSVDYIARSGAALALVVLTSLAAGEAEAGAVRGALAVF